MMKNNAERNRKKTAAQPETEKKDSQRLLSEVFDIPAAAIAGTAHFELAGNREAVIDGCQGVLEYDENVIRLSTGKMVVKFTGRSLQIKALTHDSAVVTGFITHMEFIT